MARRSPGDEPVDLPSAGQRAVLGLLALAGGQPLARSELIDALWDDRPPPSAANVIQTHVKHLRRVLEPTRPSHSRSSVLPRVGNGYALRVSAANLDLLCFRHLVGEATTALQRDDPRRAADLLGEALRLWQGVPFVDVPVLARHPKVIALAEERRAAVARYGDAMIASGTVADALPVLEETAAAQPLDEAGQARLIRAYQAVGQRARAFTTYHEIRRRLADELGVDPGPELTAAHLALLRDGGDLADEPSPPVAAASSAAVPSTASRPVPAQLPADVPGFTGRTVELSELDGLVAATDPVPTVGPLTAVVISAVAGTAGVGKTALAVRWAHRARARFPDGQLYVNLRGYDPERPMPPDEALGRFLRALGVSAQDIPLDLDERAACYRSLLDGRRILIVLDNAASADQVRPLLPGTGSCVVIVTSRDALPGLVARHGARRLDLDLLPRDDAVRLLRGLVGRRVDAEPAAAAELVARCARLPLALRVAAELAVARPGVPLTQLVGELTDERRRLELLDAGGDPRTGVRAVFSWSYRLLPPAAARTFRLLGLHPGVDLEVYAVAALIGADLDATRRQLDLLARAHLVQSTAPDRYTLHDLLRAYAVELVVELVDGEDRRAASTGLLDAWLHTAARAIDTLYPAERHRRPRVAATGAPVPDLTDPGGAQAWLDAERANLVAAVAHAATHDRPAHATRLTITLLRYVESGGHYAEAVAMHTWALRAARRIGDPAGEAHLLTNIAVVHLQQGHYERSARQLRRAIVLCRRVADSAAEARALGNLGHVYRWQGRYGQAAERLREALELCRRTGDAASEARALGNLGHVHLRQGRYAEAVDHLGGAVALCRRIGDPIGEGYALVSLGHVAVRQRRFAAATEHHRQALELFRRTSERAGEACALDGLGGVDVHEGSPRRAVDRLSQALVLFRQVGERAGEAGATNSLGEALLGAGRPERAREEHASARTLAVEIGDRYEQARAHAGLAAACGALGEAELADDHWHLALSIYADLGVPEADEVRGRLTALPRA